MTHVDSLYAVLQRDDMWQLLYTGGQQGFLPGGRELLSHTSDGGQVPQGSN
jgi:hypothetical protein